MTTENTHDATQLRTPDGPLERMVHRDSDPTEKSLLTLIEERAGKVASTASTGIDEPRNGHSLRMDDADDMDGERCLDRTMMRLGGNGF